mgnify:CR=1 FL=1
MEQQKLNKQTFYSCIITNKAKTIIDDTTKLDIQLLIAPILILVIDVGISYDVFDESPIGY